MSHGFVVRSSHGQELEEVGGSKCEAMTHMNSVINDMFVWISFVFSAGTPMQDPHSFYLIFTDLNDKLWKCVVISIKIIK